MHPLVRSWPEQVQSGVYSILQPMEEQVRAANPQIDTQQLLSASDKAADRFGTYRYEDWFKKRSSQEQEIWFLFTSATCDDRFLNHLDVPGP